MEPLVQYITGMDWNTWLSSKRTFSFLKYFQQSIGLFFLLMAFFVFSQIAIGEKRWSKKLALALLFFSSVILLLFALLHTKDKFFHFGQFLEFTIQWSLPLLLFYFLFHGLSKRLLFFFRIAIAATFIGHGLYALGYYPVPGHYVQMLISFFGCSEEAANNILTIAGMLDLVAAIGIFIPRMENYCLVYCVGWGFLTAFARLVTNVHFTFLGSGLDQWLFEVLVRLGHGGLPLFVLLRK